MTINSRSELGAELDLMAGEAIAEIRKFLQMPSRTSMDVNGARIATGALGSWSRTKATESAYQSNVIVLVRELAENKHQFRQLVRAAMPDAAIVKALPSVEGQ